MFVIDMDWHTKDNWSGFTFDSHLFPYPADTMDYLHALGMRLRVLLVGCCLEKRAQSVDMLLSLTGRTPRYVELARRQWC